VPAGDLVKETTTQAFVKDVIEASRTVPVLVDFWAPWCGPCKTLTPILEKIVRAARGKVRLVKMNIDDHPAVAGQLGVQSIPAVFAFVNGRPVDGFMGAIPESQVKTFIDRLVAANGAPDANLEQALASAKAALDEGDAKGAAEIYAAILEEDKENLEALAGLAKCYIASGDLDQAEKTLALVPPTKQSQSAIAGARAMLDLARKAPSGGTSTVALEAKLKTDPNDHQARFDLALAQNAMGNRQGAVDNLLDIMKRSRAWNDDGARKQLVQLFEAWGPKDEMTLSGRKRLSMLLFS
jgi:putative thioredoxin